MSLIAEILSPANVLTELDVGDKAQLFEAVARRLESGQGLSFAQVYDSLVAREKLGSTGMGQGTAIPHGRVKGLRQATGVFVRLKTPIPFDAPDGKPVGLLFLLLVPEHATDLHLEILGELAQLFSDRRLRERLLEAPDAVTLHALLIE